MEERLKKLMEMLPEELDGAILLAPVHRKYRDGKETDQRCGGDPAG